MKLLFYNFFIFLCFGFQSCSEVKLLEKIDIKKDEKFKKSISSDFVETPPGKLKITESCMDVFSTIKLKKMNKSLIQNVCGFVSDSLNLCLTNEGRKLFHYEKVSSRKNSKNVLVFAAFHGDEPEGAVVASHWIKRLKSIDSRNNWRIIPIMNPDGALRRTRGNSNGVDLNRNFPTNDWTALAHKYWKQKAKSSIRRFPGEKAGSEPETQCAIQHIEDFKPDLVVAIHTPYGLLDFDGPNFNLPRFAHLRWRKLGTFPGSLGRYMWKDRKIPVLTVELTASAKILDDIEKINSLQDLSGIIAIKSSSLLKKI